MKHIEPASVKPADGQADFPLYCVLVSGPGCMGKSCIFPYENAEGDKFVADMVNAGWTSERVDDHLILHAPAPSNIVPFPLAHPLLRGL